MNAAAKMEGLKMKTRFLETAPMGKRFVHAFHASLVLCVLASFTCIPALADTATFYVAASATVTLPSVSNISYSVIDNQPGMFASETGNAGLVFNNQSFTFSNETLTYEYGPAAGFVASPLVSSSSYFSQHQDTYLQITNINDYGVELPITASLNYDGNVTAVGAVSSFSEAYLDLIYQPVLGSPAVFYVGAICNQEPSNCSPFLFQGDIKPPTMSPVTVTSSLLIPANTVLVLTVISGVNGDAAGSETLPTPEPGTLTLLGTGLVGLAGVVRRKG
jgi:hypothetical protein